MRTKRRKKKEWKRIVENYKKSHKTKAEYCKEHNINVGLFRNWCYKLGSKSTELKAEVEGVKNSKEPFIGFRISQVGIKINLPNGINVEVTGQDVIGLIKGLMNVA